MGKITGVENENLVIGFLYRDAVVYEKAKELLCAKFGGIDYQSPALIFRYTDYYEEEMGKELTRRFISFEKTVDPASLADIKVFTNSVEEDFFYKDTLRRQINIDPGLLSLGKFVLATTKNYSHRVYIGKGIFGEVTLQYKDKRFTGFDWTYPDYQTPEYTGILGEIRAIFKEKLK